MRKWVIIGTAGIAVVMAVFVLRGTGEDASPHPSSSRSDVGATRYGSGLEPVFVPAGEVLVSIEPLKIDRSGASFRIGFETHTVDLSLDVARSASFAVDGTPWLNPTWSGSPAGGHHRDGELRFDAGGAPVGRAVLTIDGLDEPVVASWSVG